jgi:phosphate-selective porin OprO/OprP
MRMFAGRRRALILALMICSTWGLWASETRAQETADPAKTTDLEQRVRNLEAMLQLPSSAPPQGGTTDTKKADPPVTAGWHDGFYVQSPTKDFILRITGQIQTDYHAYLHKGDNTDIDTFLVRRARLGIEATVMQYYEFRLLPDFGQGQARIQDSYLNVHYWDAFQIEAGKFKQPCSYEQMIQDRFVPTAERSLIDQLVPARDVGLMLHGQNLFDNRFDYAVAVSDGEINGDIDTNNHKDLAARVVIRPFGNDETESFRKRLEFGVSGTTGIQSESLATFVYRTPASIPFLQFNANVRAEGLRTRLSPEMDYFYRGFGFAAQYYVERQDLRQATARSSFDVPTQGFYVLTTLLLTGESRTKYSEPIKPLTNFDLRHPLSAPGAWELVGRASRLQVDSRIFAPGALRLADPSRNADGATEMTLGFNWYLNPWVRTQFNWEHSWFDQGVQLGVGPNKVFTQQDALIARFQVIF